jgi:hypothetical protein
MLSLLGHSPSGGLQLLLALRQTTHFVNGAPGGLQLLLLLSATEEELARRELQHALTMEQAAKADALAAAAAAGAAKAEVLGRLAAAEGTRKAALRRLAVQQEHKDMLAQQQVLFHVNCNSMYTLTG